MWNDDWDGAGLVINDYLFHRGRELPVSTSSSSNRGYGDDGPGDRRPARGVPLARLGRRAAGRRGPRAVDRELGGHQRRHPCIFANSGRAGAGLGTSPDFGTIPPLCPSECFRFLDRRRTPTPSLVIDAEGMIYAGVEYQRGHGPVPRGGPDHQARPEPARRSAGVGRRRAGRSGRVGGVGHAGPAPRPADRAHPHRSRLRGGHRHRGDPLDQEAARTHLVQPRHRRRCVDPGATAAAGCTPST